MSVASNPYLEVVPPAGGEELVLLDDVPRRLPAVELHNVEVARPRGEFPFPVFQGAQGYHHQVRPPQSLGPAFSTRVILGAVYGNESS